MDRTSPSRLFKWAEIARVPPQPGVYAWYYLVDITDFDIKRAVEKVNEYKQLGDSRAAERVIEEFLDRFVHRYFAEAPYRALIRGPLKPRYEGELGYVPESSEALVRRITDAPDRLWTLQGVLRRAVPNFASPIYIGMSDNLQVRLNTHRRLIEQYRAGQSTSFGFGTDQNFARRVVERDLSPSGLRVAVEVIPSTETEYIDAENILNRINYPILGRK